VRLFLNGKAATSLIVLYAPEMKTLQRPQKASPEIQKATAMVAFVFSVLSLEVVLFPV
jgi:hypothetical protein